MSNTEKVILFFVVLFVSIITYINLNTPSCEDKGGELKFTHMLMIPTKIGNTTIMQQHPQYKCEFNKGE
jgi:hypothetical protein